MDRLLPTTSDPKPDSSYARDAGALRSLRAAWDEVIAARERLFELLADPSGDYELWHKAMCDEMLAHVAFVELAKDVANRVFVRAEPASAHYVLVKSTRAKRGGA